MYRNFLYSIQKCTQMENPLILSRKNKKSKSAVDSHTPWGYISKQTKIDFLVLVIKYQSSVSYLGHCNTTQKTYIAQNCFVQQGEEIKTKQLSQKSLLSFIQLIWKLDLWVMTCGSAIMHHYGGNSVTSHYWSNSNSITCHYWSNTHSITYHYPSNSITCHYGYNSITCHFGCNSIIRHWWPEANLWLKTSVAFLNGF